MTLAVGGTAVLAGAGADTPAFSNGTAVAQASVLRIAPGVGSLALATTTGTSLAHVSNKLAEAQAQAADFGLIGSSLTAQGCDGSPGALKPEQLPQPLVVDNRKGPASGAADEFALGSGTVGAGHKEASADPTPASRASVTDAGSSLGSVVTLSGGRSDAIARVVPGKAREAEATASADIDIAGVVTLRNAQWHAIHRTGENPNQTGSFSVTSSAVGGVPLPVDQMQPLQDAMNQALAATGVSVSLPHVQHITTPNDFVEVTPLRITLQDTPVGKATVGPVLNATREQREQILNQLYGTFCQAAGAGLVADIGLDIVSGTGFLIIDIGGVSVSSKDVQYENPFGAIPPFTAAVETTPNLPADTTGAGSVPASVTPVTGDSHVLPGSSTPAVLAPAAPIAKTGPLEKICESLSPAKRPACSAGAGVPLILIAVGLTGGFAYLDWLHQRKILAASEAEATV